MRYHFIGIAGSGMSALAHLTRAFGHEVSGSDRSFDRQQQSDLRQALASLGIMIFPQDGSGIGANMDAAVFSTAVESTNPDIARSLKFKIPLIRRAALLAQFFDQRFGIAISGTSGKSTVAAMVATMLRTLGKDPTYYGGAMLIGHESCPALANAYCGTGPYFCAEADESDSSFLEFHPKLSVVTNITKDHKPVEELAVLFSQFLEQTRQILVLNADCPTIQTLRLPDKEILWFGTDTSRFPLTIDHVSFDSTLIHWKGVPCKIMPGGKHNISNALAALTTAEALRIPLADAARALESFQGVRRRMELKGKAGGVFVFDDFAHNPAKIEATLGTLQNFFSRIVVVFQLHGFGPARFMKKDLELLFPRILRREDRLILPDIFDAGGTAERSIHAQDLVEGIKSSQTTSSVRYLPTREEISRCVMKETRPGDAVVVMGARDPSLPQLCEQILRAIESKN